MNYFDRQKIPSIKPSPGEVCADRKTEVRPSEAEPRALHGAERLVVVRGEAELLGVGPRLDVFPRLCEIKILRRVRAEFRAGRAVCEELRLRRIRYLVFGSLNNDRRPASSIAGSALTPEPLKRAKPRPVYRDGAHETGLVAL